MTPPFKRNPETHRATELDEAAIWAANDDDCSQRWTWEHYALGLAVALPAAWAIYLILK